MKHKLGDLVITSTFSGRVIGFCCDEVLLENSRLGKRIWIKEQEMSLIKAEDLKEGDWIKSADGRQGTVDCISANKMCAWLKLDGKFGAYMAVKDIIEHRPKNAEMKIEVGDWIETTGGELAQVSEVDDARGGMWIDDGLGKNFIHKNRIAGFSKGEKGIKTVQPKKQNGCEWSNEKFIVDFPEPQICDLEATHAIWKKLGEEANQYARRNTKEFPVCGYGGKVEVKQAKKQPDKFKIRFVWICGLCGNC